jgi:branched-chain amino acid transport system substrate-binding protein
MIPNRGWRTQDDRLVGCLGLVGNLRSASHDDPPPALARLDPRLYPRANRQESEGVQKEESVRKLIVAAVAGLAALVLTVPGALGGASETGITSKSIVIGGTFPLTGPASAYAPIAPAMKAYFAYINSRKGPDGKRGVYGRQIVFKYYDDAYNPANTVQLTRKLVEQDKVFAIVGQLGTEVCLSVEDYLNQRKIPQVLVSTGATELSQNYKEFPWTIGWQPDYIAEGRLYGLDIKKNFAGKKIAVLYQNDAYGKDYLYGLKIALGTQYSKANIVAEEPYEVTAPDDRAQMAKVKASGAPVFVILATPKFTIQAYAFGKAFGYNPQQIYVNSVGATSAYLKLAVGAAGAAYVNGSLSDAYLLDPSNPAQANLPAIKLYKQLMAKYNPKADPTDQLNLYGFAKAETFVQAMYAAGKNPTRASLMNALTHMNSKNKFALPGVLQKTSPKDHFILSQMRLQRFSNGVWSNVGPLVDGRPR